MTNFRAMDLTLEEVVAFDINLPDQALVGYEGRELAGNVFRPGKPKDLPASQLLSGGERAIVFMWITFEMGTQVPAAIAHRATFLRTGSSGEAKRYSVEGAVVQVPGISRLLLHPPVPPGRWLHANGPSNSADHRRTVIALDGTARNSQRFASDWMLLGDDGSLAEGDMQANTSWFSHGVALLAVADGVVCDAVDGIPENVPLAEQRAVPNKRETISGNHVILDLGGGAFAFYGHLLPGSLRVKPGDRVQAGQVIGLLGNTGNSDAPHLHFHVANAPDPLAAEGLPFAFTTFSILERLSIFQWERILLGDATWHPPADLAPCRYEGEMPLGDGILEFE
jgi:hypothetical protein